MKILSIDEAKKFIVDGKKIVFITGVTGQDGSFMTDYLLKNTDYIIFGGARRLSVSNHENIDHLRNESRFHLINFDLTDTHSITQIVSRLVPDYFINFAAQSFVKSSWDFPAQTWEANTTSLIHILEAIRLHAPKCRFYNAGSSEEFGNVVYTPQDENHPIRPRSPYGASKAAARQIVKVYRESYGLYAVQGWLFNHEGTRRGEEFVTRKITKEVVRIYNEIINYKNPTPLYLGNLDARRDWSDAEDCVVAVWLMLNQDTFTKYGSIYDANASNGEIVPHIKEYVVSSGEHHDIREFVKLAFKEVGISGKWEGKGLDEKFIYLKGPHPLIDHPPIVKVDQGFYRPAEVELLCGNSTRIRDDLGWEPKTKFPDLVKKMVNKDLHK